MAGLGTLGRIGLALATGSALVASIAIAQTAPAPGPCPMHGMMGMGSGMMEHDMMGWQRQPPGNLNLTVDDVRASVERSIAMMGNPRLKPGRIVATNDDTITAEIVTVDKEALVQRYAVNRHTGYWQQVP